MVANVLSQAWENWDALESHCHSAPTLYGEMGRKTRSDIEQALAKATGAAPKSQAKYINRQTTDLFESMFSIVTHSLNALKESRFGPDSVFSDDEPSASTNAYPASEIKQDRSNYVAVLEALEEALELREEEYRHSDEHKDDDSTL